CVGVWVTTELCGHVLTARVNDPLRRSNSDRGPRATPIHPYTHTTMFSRHIIASVLAVWLLTGVYLVRANEQAVVRRFGGVVADRVPPGLHLTLPWGIDRV